MYICIYVHIYIFVFTYTYIYYNRGTIRCTAQIGSHPSLAENCNFVCTSQGLVLIKGKGYMEVYDVVFKVCIAVLQCVLQFVRGDI